MESIFESNGNDNLVARINEITPESQPLWGKMNSSQMLKHCAIAIDVAFGEKQLKISFPLSLLGRLLKNKVFKSEFGKNSPTAKEFICNIDYDFNHVKEDLIQKVKRFSEVGTSAIKLKKHPFWGPMTTDDWNTLMWKHLDHHLRQFGV